VKVLTVVSPTVQLVTSPRTSSALGVLGALGVLEALGASGEALSEQAAVVSVPRARSAMAAARARREEFVMDMAELEGVDEEVETVDGTSGC
jgi:hypothetical protein